MRHPDPIPLLLQTLQCNDAADACKALLKELVLKPAWPDKQFPQATAELVQRLVSEYLAQVPLLELCSILVWFLPQVPREQPQDRIMTRPELHSFPTPSRLVYKFEGLGGMDHFDLHLERPADLPFVFAPSLPQPTWVLSGGRSLVIVWSSSGDRLIIVWSSSDLGLMSPGHRVGHHLVLVCSNLVHRRVIVYSSSAVILSSSGGRLVVICSEGTLERYKKPMSFGTPTFA